MISEQKHGKLLASFPLEGNEIESGWRRKGEESEVVRWEEREGSAKGEEERGKRKEGKRHEI